MSHQLNAVDQFAATGRERSREKELNEPLQEETDGEECQAHRGGADVIARAQGVTPGGNAEDIVLVRDGQRLRAGITGMESLQGAGIRSGDQIIVGRRSWASRNFSSMVGIISILANVFVIVAR